MTQSLATPTSSFLASGADGLLWEALAETSPMLTVFTPLALTSAPESGHGSRIPGVPRTIMCHLPAPGPVGRETSDRQYDT